MAEPVLMIFLQVVLDRLASPILEELKLQLKVNEDLKKLCDTMSIIQAVLCDAEERQYKDGENAVRLWLRKLKEVAYDMNDVLDEFATEALRRKFVKFQKVRTDLSFLSLKRLKFHHKIASSIKEINERVDDIAKKGRDLRLNESSGVSNSIEGGEPFQTSSLRDASCVFGRENDKGNLVRLLVSDEHNNAAQLSVITIVGMGGLGKTTLAQHVYNDDAIEKHFELKLWVHVSQNFNVNRLTKSILESIVHCVYDPLELNLLQDHLRKNLNGRRYLLVLDDVWNESKPVWESLRVPLLYGAKGSKVIVTTRSKKVANSMGTTTPYNLKGLSNDDCWSLFAQYAFQDKNPHTFQDLNRIGGEVTNKCRGLPLAAKTLGCLLRFEDIHNWNEILRTQVWELPEGSNDLFSAIRLSYQLLPTHLKRCFVYCSIFPKCFKFEKEILVQLWMAQDFIQPRAGERIEDAGSRYFDCLLQRSFFENLHFDYKKERPKYVIHDLIHDFAQSISVEECCIVKHDKAPEKVCHSSLVYDLLEPKVTPPVHLSKQEGNKFEMLYASKGLYTLLLVGDYVRNVMEVPDDLAKKLIRLRTLDLSNSDLHELPKSIGDLKHLRYLGLCNTKIGRLPESVSCLYNLQTLGLRNCYRLEELPDDTRNLINLRHLDLHLDRNSMLAEQGNSSSEHVIGNLRSMPPEIGNLIGLQTLSRYVINRKDGYGLKELKQLNNLRGELCISNLHSVLNSVEAMEANMMDKQYLDLLELRWSDVDDNFLYTWSQRVEEEVLQSLQPHTRLKVLWIGGYRGVSFPAWIGNSSFSNLVNLKLTNCRKCEILPSLGHLPVLEDLYIEGMHCVKLINCAFCGQGEVAFPSLRRLQFNNMLSLQNWFGQQECGLFSLQELIIKNCPELQLLTHNLPTLKKLEIERCPRLLGLPRFPSLQSLDVKHSGEWIWGTLPCLSSLSSLTLSGLPMSTFPSGLRRDLTSLRCLEITHCYELISLPDEWLPIGLTSLGIKHCPQLRNLPKGLKSLNGLEDLEIHDCQQLLTLPVGLKNLISLERFEIEDCPQLKSLPSDGLPKDLQVLSINNSPLLKKRCQKDRGEDWPKIKHILSVWIDGELVVSTGRC